MNALETAGRPLVMAWTVARDTALAGGRSLWQPVREPDDGALQAAASWLLRTHEATGRRGSSQGYSLLSGWAPAFPETTGYVIGTLLEYARLTGEAEPREAARAMTEWSIEVQTDDGGTIQGVVGGGPPRPIVFNTGMVLHGFVDAHAEFGEQRYLDAGRRAGDFLVRHLPADGAWRGEVTYLGLPHTYKSRVAWAMLRLGEATGEQAYGEAAVRHLDWVLTQQRPNGWFDTCNFKPGRLPNSHGIAYTLRGLLESHAITGDERYLDAVVRTTEQLMRKQEVLGWIPAVWGPEWQPAVRYECLTGTVQLGNVWLRLFEITGDARYLNAGLKAVDAAAAHQSRLPWPEVRGALPGSFPVYGRYSPLRFPNWPTKFLLDALLRRREHTGRPAS